MRKASYEVPRAKGDSEDGELAVFYFGPGQGGGIDANVERWIKQFSGVKPEDVKRADRKANGLVVHTADAMAQVAATPIDGLWPVTQRGPCRIWDTIESAVATWELLDRPERSRLR